MRVAIDGPVASGKDTVGRRTAQELGFTYIDSGALFRAVALFCLDSDIPVQNKSVVCRAISASPPDIQLQVPSDLHRDGRAETVLLNQQDVTWNIRTPRVDNAVPPVSTHQCVRDFILKIQRALAREADVIMSGRDIGTFVWPDAELKIFLTGDAKVRAQRRYQEHLAQGKRVTLKDVLIDMNRRDREDERRPLRPLKKAPDAVEVDTTNMTIDEVVARIVKLARP